MRKEYQRRRRRRRAQGRGEGRAARTGLASVLKCLKCARTEQVRIKSASGRARSKARYMQPGGPQTWGFEAGRRGGKEDGSGEEPQPSRRRQAEHSHAHALAACGARGGGCRGEGGDRAREHTPFFRGDGADTSWSSNRCGRPRSREDHCGASALLPRSRDCGASALLPRSRDCGAPCCLDLGTAMF